MGGEEMKARLKELEEEQPKMNDEKSAMDHEKAITEWAFAASLHAYESDDENDKPSSTPISMSTLTMREYPDSNAAGSSSQTQGNQAVFAADYHQTESSESLCNIQESVYATASTMDHIHFTPTMAGIGHVIHSDPTGTSYQYDGTGLSEDGCEDLEFVLDSVHVKGKEQQGSVNTHAIDPNSPNYTLNLSNPHPTLSITTSFLQKAILDSRKSGTPFVRSIIRRDRLHGKESTVTDEYTKWKWIPYPVHDLATELVSTNITEGDIELICMNDIHFTKMIQNNEPMFENRRSPGTGILEEQLKPVFKHPEASGYRVLVWRLHRSKKSFYRDRDGHSILEPADADPESEPEAKNTKLCARESEGFGRRIPGL
ncbi:hypothetical protein FBEOM_4535 [Fusarium beomiforme]|uniref:Uncharacterized protein n=1 Tax=Fusarium beomiforme TaxID=44412 RepID=A0A9P5AMI0_9HYPO|nr:hypothetical protein FBEOM_4535 [Fusarium beomiforme]